MSQPNGTFLGSNAKDCTQLIDGDDLFRVAFENAPIGMVLATPDLTSVQVNRALCAMLGYTEEEILEIGSWALTHPEDTAPNLTLMQRALAGEIDSYDIEKRYVHRDGRIVWAHLHGSLVRDHAGAPRYFISQIQDISRRKAAEAVLAETHQGTRQVLERVTDAFYALDREWRFTYINDAAEQIFGRRRADMLGKNVWAEFASALDTPVYDAYQQALAEGTPIEMEFFYPAFDAWYFVSAYPSDEGLSVFFRDVTEQRRLMQDLRASEARYRTLIEYLPAVVYEQANDDRQTSTYFSPQVEKLTGFSMAEILDQPPGESWHDFLHPDDRARVAAEEARSVASGAPFRCEYRLVRRDGGYVWVRDECEPVRDEAGEIVSWQGVLLDITERIQVEQAFAASEIRFGTAFENAPIGMALTSPQFGVLQVNRALCDMLGHDAEELIDTSLRGLTHPDDIAANQSLIDRTLAGEIDSFEMAKRYFHKDGHIVWALLHVSLVRDDRGAPDYFISQTQDITAQKHAEAALRAALDAAQAASKAKSSFLATMSHELRTPLQAVLGYSEFLLSESGDALTAEQREDIGYIHNGGSRMMSLIAQMLDLSRIEAGALQISRARIDLRAILEEVREDVALQAEGKGLELVIEASPALPTVLGDALRLRQILLNLVGNAVKFTERGTIRVHATDAENGVRLTVQDTGVGIAPDALPHIFEEFRQVDSTLARRHGGAGLGLAISQRLAGLMGSHIEVDSEVGVGSTFSLHLDAASPAAIP